MKQALMQTMGIGAAVPATDDEFAWQKTKFIGYPSAAANPKIHLLVIQKAMSASMEAATGIKKVRE